MVNISNHLGPHTLKSDTEGGFVSFLLESDSSTCQLFFHVSNKLGAGVRFRVEGGGNSSEILQVLHVRSNISNKVVKMALEAVSVSLELL